MAFPVPSEVNPTSLPLPHPEAYEGEPREYARALMQRKDAIEREIVSIDHSYCTIACHSPSGRTQAGSRFGEPTDNPPAHTCN